jgi:endonuclease-3
MTKKKLIERKTRAKKINACLKKLFPRARISLNYSNNWELLVAVSLSAQCTDVMVNRVTKSLFKKYKTIDDYANATQSAMKEDVRKTGFYNNKAKNLIAAAKRVRDVYGFEVPDTMEELLTIPGVARKTANVVLGNAFGKNIGIAVDTHVRRFAIRFDLSDYKDPIRIEKDFMKLFPKKDWNTITYRFIEYGRNVCPARKHDCEAHPLTSIFPEAQIIWPKAK